MDTRLRSTEGFFYKSPKVVSIVTARMTVMNREERLAYIDDIVLLSNSWRTRGNHAQGKPGTSLLTTSLRVRTMEKWLGKTLKRSRTGPSSLWWSIPLVMLVQRAPSECRHKYKKVQVKNPIEKINYCRFFLFLFCRKKLKSLSRKLLWNLTRPLHNPEFRPFHNQWKFRLRRWDVKIE